MKKVLIGLVTLLLISCSNNTLDLQKELENALNKEIALKPFLATNNKPYYSYYVSPSLGNVYSDQTTNILVYQNNKILMNLNTSNIINDAYYNQLSNDVDVNNYLMFALEGSFVDINDETINYKLEVFNIKNQRFMKLSSKYVNFYTEAEDYELIQLSRYMIQIARSVTVNKQNVLVAYSTKENISVDKEAIQLFEQVAPVDGNIIDILDNKETIDNTAGDDYNNQIPTVDPASQNDDEYSSDDYKDY